MIADLSEHLGHTAAFLQLNDILTTEIPPGQRALFLEELEAYLEHQELRMSRYEGEAVELVLEGLYRLREIARAARESDPEGWLEAALEADDFIREGTQLLQAA